MNIGPTVVVSRDGITAIMQGNREKKGEKQKQPDTILLRIAAVIQIARRRRSVVTLDSGWFLGASHLHAFIRIRAELEQVTNDVQLREEHGELKGRP